VQFAERAALDFRSIDDVFVTDLRRHFSDAEIAELGMMIQQYIALGRLLVMAGGDKMACEIYVPEV
jgi:alkylhydroperoxidase family enzyme